MEEIQAKFQKIQIVEESTAAVNNTTVQMFDVWNPAISNTKVTPCPLCTKKHCVRWCPVFKSKTPCQRGAVARHFNLCKNCLAPTIGNPTHNFGCESTNCCHLCGRRHHTMLHRKYDKRWKNRPTKNQRPWWHAGPMQPQQQINPIEKNNRCSIRMDI